MADILVKGGAERCFEWYQAQVVARVMIAFQKTIIA
jgi:hypothetical protein